MILFDVAVLILHEGLDGSKKESFPRILPLVLGYPSLPQHKTMNTCTPTSYESGFCSSINC